MSKACEYIKELRQSNVKLGEDINSLDRLRIDNQLLRQEVGVQDHRRPTFLIRMTKAPLLRWKTGSLRIRS